MMLRCLSSLSPIALLWRALARANDERDEALEQAARLALVNEHLRQSRAQALRKAWVFKAAAEQAERDFAELVEGWPVEERRHE